MTRHMEFRSWILWIALAAVTMALGCDPEKSDEDSKDSGSDGDSDSDTGSDGDGDSDTVSDSDSDTDGDTDSEKDTGPSEPPLPPVISVPKTGQKVASPVRVEGTGESSATVFVVVLNGDKEIGGHVGSVGGNGTFALSVDYAPPSSGTELTIQVLLKNTIGTSESAEVDVVHQPQTLSGTVTQENGSDVGTSVRVRLYANATEAVDYLQELTLPATEGKTFGTTPYSFEVGEGSYYARAFRDSHGAHWGEADGEPTYPEDAQSPASAEIVIAGEDATGVNLVLTEPAAAGYFQDFNVYTYNESAEPRVPDYEDPPDSGNWKTGKGLCEGYHMTISVWGRDDISQLSTPMVHLPDGTAVALLDDGACGDAADNTSMSYDYKSHDNYFHYGWPDPTDSDRGAYRFSYRDKLLDFIHVETDDVDAVVKLSRNAVLTFPTGASPAPLSATLTWEPIVAANAYIVWLSSHASKYEQESGILTEPSFKPKSALPDDASFSVNLRIFDSDISDGQDFDAEASSVSSHFITDSDGKSSITISGDIINETNVSAPIRIDAIYNTDWWEIESSIIVPKDQTTYSLVMLRKTGEDDEVRLQAFIDVDGSGDNDSSENSQYSFESDKLDTSDNVELDIVFRPPLKLKSPGDGAEAVGTAPKFTWEDYSAHAPDGPWSYALFAFNRDAGNGGFPDIVWGLPNTTTSLDFSNASQLETLYDVIYLFTCLQSGGTYADGVCTGGDATHNAKDLKAGTEWDWGVVVIECDFADYSNNVDSDKNNIDDYTDCIEPALGQQGNFYVMSDSWSLQTN